MDTDDGDGGHRYRVRVGSHHQFFERDIYKVHDPTRGDYLTEEAILLEIEALRQSEKAAKNRMFKRKETGAMVVFGPWFNYAFQRLLQLASSDNGSSSTTMSISMGGYTAVKIIRSLFSFITDDLKDIVKYGRLNDLKTKMGVDWLRNVGTARKVINHCGDSANFLHDELVKVEAHVQSLVIESFILNFHNGDYDTKFDIALCSDRDVATPHARPTQASYNKPDNWRERNRFGLTKVKEQLQSCIRKVTNHQDFQLKLDHQLWPPWRPHNEEPIVWHEQILDYYWNQLENEIDRRKQLGVVTEITGIDIINVEMKNERLAALVAILSSGRATSSSTCVSFKNANLCEDGIISLSKLVDFSSQLTNISLYYNRIDGMLSARCLARSLKSHACITELHLAHCNLGSSPEILMVILQSDVDYINLEHNYIDSLGAAKITEYLEGDPPIKELSLHHNCLNDDDSLLISQALKRNTNLKTMSIHSNNLTAIGVKALLTCVFDNSSLNAISESNHTLAGMNFFSDNNRPITRFLRDRIARLLCFDRTQKIVLALQDKDSLLQYLANVPVGLMPEVMAYPLRQVDNQYQLRYLNILYYTMRWWNMPVLYSSYHNCVKSDAKRNKNQVA